MRCGAWGPCRSARQRRPCRGRPARCRRGRPASRCHRRHRSALPADSRRCCLGGRRRRSLCQSTKGMSNVVGWGCKGGLRCAQTAHQLTQTGANPPKPKLDSRAHAQPCSYAAVLMRSCAHAQPCSCAACRLTLPAALHGVGVVCTNLHPSRRLQAGGGNRSRLGVQTRPTCEGCMRPSGGRVHRQGIGCPHEGLPVASTAHSSKTAQARE